MRRDWKEVNNDRGQPHDRAVAGLPRMGGTGKRLAALLELLQRVADGDADVEAAAGRAEIP